MEEEFRTCDYLLNKYEINNSGTIIRNIKTKKHLKIKIDTHHCSEKYAGHKVTFVHVGGRSPESKTIRIQIGRAVLESWVGKQPEGMEVDHRNRNSLDDSLENLRYVTKSEQMKNRDYSNISKKGKANLEAARNQRAIPVDLIKDGNVFKFESISECARWLGTIANESPEKIRYYLRSKRNNIHGYDVVYYESEQRNDLQRSINEQRKFTKS